MHKCAGSCGSYRLSPPRVSNSGDVITKLERHNQREINRIYFADSLNFLLCAAVLQTAIVVFSKTFQPRSFPIFLFSLRKEQHPRKNKQRERKSPLKTYEKAHVAAERKRQKQKEKEIPVIWDIQESIPFSYSPPKTRYYLNVRVLQAEKKRTFN